MMPSGPDHLHEKWGDDGAAWKYLQSLGWTHTKGVIQPKPGHEMTDEERDAIEYLCLEWDWGYELIARST